MYFNMFLLNQCFLRFIRWIFRYMFFSNFRLNLSNWWSQALITFITFNIHYSLDDSFFIYWNSLSIIVINLLMKVNSSRSLDLMFFTYIHDFRLLDFLIFIILIDFILLFILAWFLQRRTFIFWLLRLKWNFIKSIRHKFFLE